MKGLFSADFTPVETLRAIALFALVPVVWWLAVLFIRVERGRRWDLVRSLLRGQLLFMYLLVPGAILPAVALWWCVGSLRPGGPAALPFGPFWFASYIVIALGYSWMRSRTRPAHSGE